MYVHYWRTIPNTHSLKRTLGKVRRCPLNRGFTVYIFFVGVLLTNPSPTSIQGTLALVPRVSPEQRFHCIIILVKSVTSYWLSVFSHLLRYPTPQLPRLQAVREHRRPPGDFCQQITKILIRPEVKRVVYPAFSRQTAGRWCQETSRGDRKVKNFYGGCKLAYAERKTKTKGKLSYRCVRSGPNIEFSMCLTKLSDESLDLKTLSIRQRQTDRRSEDAAVYSIQLFTGITKRIGYKRVYASRGPTCNLSRPIFSWQLI